VTEPDLGAPTTLILVRHGHADATGQALLGGGDAGPELNSTGQHVAEILGKVLASLPSLPGPGELGRPRVLITSPARRASQTAEKMGAVLGLRPEVDEDLNEVLAGDWQGLSIAQIIEGWPAEYRAWQESSAVVPPNGESHDQLALRVAVAADRIVAAHYGQVVVIVSHAGPIRALLSAALNADPVAARRLRIDPASVSVLRVWSDGGCEVSAVNTSVA
jgi:probable phosphoglycerate mutase